MDNANTQQTQPAAVEESDWKNQLSANARQRVVGKILETLKRCVPLNGVTVLHELNEIAVRFEEVTYRAATSRSDYLRRISAKMLTMEMKSHNNSPKLLPSEDAPSSSNPDIVFKGEYRHEIPTCSTKGVFGDLTQDQPDDVPTALESINWRVELLPSSRLRIAQKIAKALEGHLPVSREIELKEIMKLVVRFEEEIYNAAESESDYLSKISRKMFALETKFAK